MSSKEAKGMAFLLFGILLCVSGAEINDTLLRSVADFPFSLFGLIIGTVGLVMVFVKDTDKKAK